MDSIVTLTMNPALDVTADADVVRPTPEFPGFMDVNPVAIRLAAQIEIISHSRSPLLGDLERRA